MRRDRRNSGKKERIVMIASSVFVLAALTMTGIYMQTKNVESKDDGYTIDFEALENNTNNKSNEIAQNRLNEQANLQADKGERERPEQAELNLEDDLDYMPLEAGSALVEIPGLTDVVSEEAEKPESTTKPENTEKPESSAKPETTPAPKKQKDLHFAEGNGLLRPVSGEVLLPFSMDSSIYFSTLDQYKYNPAMMIQAEEGTAVAACAEGKVVNIFEDAEIGHAVTMELGGGYEITYGQLKDISVTLDSYVEPGETVGMVAAPTKYFSVEGANLYLELTADGTPVNPESLFK